jgi:hypothetical protein
MCAGHERFHGVAAEHLRSAHGVLAVYDVADTASLAALLDTFLPQLSRYHRTRLQQCNTVVTDHAHTHWHCQ